MSRLASYLEKDFKKKFVYLCLSEGKKVHILHYYQDKSICGDIATKDGCQLIRRLPIRDILDYWVERIESVKNSHALFSVWDRIDHVHDQALFYSSFDALISEMSEAGQFDDALAESSTIVRKDLLEARFCRKCMGFFLGALFSTKAQVVNELVDKYKEEIT